MRCGADLSDPIRIRVDRFPGVAARPRNRQGEGRDARVSVDLNVAASRAQRRPSVIGDRAGWAEHNYFRQLVAALAAENAGAG